MTLVAYFSMQTRQTEALEVILSEGSPNNRHRSNTIHSMLYYKNTFWRKYFYFIFCGKCWIFCRKTVKKCGCIFAPERQWDVKNVCTLKFDQINDYVQWRNLTNISRKSINGMRKIQNTNLIYKQQILDSIISITEKIAFIIYVISILSE